MKWHCQDDEPDACSAVGCKEQWNGFYYAKIKVGKARFWINACARCKKKAESK